MTCWVLCYISAVREEDSRAFLQLVCVAHARVGGGGYMWRLRRLLPYITASVLRPLMRQSFVH